MRGVGLVVLGLMLFSCSSQSGFLTPAQRGADLVFSVRSLAPEIPVFYTYRYKNKKINFFVIKIDGRVLSFLDACKACYHNRLGFEFHDGYVMCRSCKNSYAIRDIEKGLSSCYPIRIEGRLEDDTYMISVSTLENMADMF
ncbi:MAG: DUF2318 domain-containing protein [Nitrospirae bacterium]|nr:DUF2318 domain-containing protein [Nitrospirota bacterium]